MCEVRLQKFLADCGVCSRRKAENLILEGKVSVNGHVVKVLGTKVSPETDAVMVDGEVVDLKLIKKIYLLMNKPRGFVTTVNDPEGRKTVMDLCLEVSERIYPVGRLDYLSEGLLLLTNDGELANQVMHPKFDVVKVYEVKVFGRISPQILKSLREGILLEDGMAKPLSVRVIKQLPSKTWLEFRLAEGRNREIRRICEASGIVIDKLKRVAIGSLTVDGIAPGNFRFLNKKQVLSALFENEKNAFYSSKKTIPLRGKFLKGKGTEANDERFQKFKKETYFESLKAIDETKKMVAERKAAEELKEREEAFEKRKRKKILRQKRQEEKRNSFAPHAILLDK